MWEQLKKDAQNDDYNGVMFTENGAVTFKSSGMKLVDLFFKVGAMRNADEDMIERVIADAWEESPEITTRIMLWARDVRGGAGERRVFRVFLKWLERNGYKKILISVIYKIPEIGRWDDMFVVHPRYYIDLVAEELYKKNGLLAKWLPREKSKKWPKLAREIANHLGLSMRQYRKMIAELSKTVEQQMSANEWEEVNYSQVPSIAGMRYKNAFMRHDPYRYQDFINKVKSGKEKLNVKVLYPYQVLQMAKRGDKDADLFWEKLPNYLEKADGFILPIADVSGSMESIVGGSTTAMDVSTSIALYIGDKQPKPWNEIAMSFSAKPKFIVWDEHDNLRNKYRAITSNGGLNTNLVGSFELLLSYAKRHNLSQDEMPKYVLVISDMEFDAAQQYNSWNVERFPKWNTNYDVIKRKFENAGYKLPLLVFWNVMARHLGNIPVKFTEKGVALISGFSPKIMEMVLSLNENKLNPINLMLETVMQKRYNF